ncbi:MAG: DUF5011 domain-containing protein [bacterium]|nr:DUF5011 domain-containing protein [bacterium]
MRLRQIVLSLTIGALSLSAPSAAFAATVFFAQTDASVQSTLPPRNQSVAQVFVSAVSGNAKTIAIRTTSGNNGSIDCSLTIKDNFNITYPMRLAIRPANATSSQPIWNGDFAWYVASSTAPDAEGNCFYNSFHTADAYQNYSYYPYSYGALTDGALVAGNTYIVLIDDSYLRWNHESWGGSSSGSGSGVMDSVNAFVPGGVGVSSFFMTISDTSSYVADHNVGISGTTTPATTPTITLLGSATTTAEFGSTFTDPGATANDAIDGNLTSAIHITGSVNTGVMGTTTLSYAVTNSSGLSATTTRDVVVACTHDCYDNVLFLPGIEGSRLYEGTGCGGAAEEKLWDPVADSVLKILRGAGDDKVKKLFLDSAGKSVCSDVYAKADDIIGTVSGSNIYKSFIDEMNGLVTDGTVAAWKATAYDWRLSLTDLLTNGAEHGGKIYYAEATSIPYIEQTLRALAAGSKTGKVTIVAHSNGGLVAKALLNQLGGLASKSLVDKLIMVGAPQSGAPESLGALLVGYNAGIYKFGFPIVSDTVARDLAANSPMTYHLLPSEDYLESTAGDSAHPVARFAGDAYSAETSAYGATIRNRADMDSFIRSFSTTNSSLIDYANTQHASLDFWSPPDGISVSQIAGWGADTVAGIDFYTPPPVSVAAALSPIRAYRPIFTEDGDGIVPVPSAIMMASSTSVKRYWVNLFTYNRDSNTGRKHKDIFEITQLEDFIKNIIKNSTSTLPAYIVTSQPATITDNKKLTFFLHSPLTLELTDASGNVTGLATDGSMTQDIPNSSYGEFGDVKYVTVPHGSSYTLTMRGQESGTFSLDMQESSGGVVTTSSTIANVPTTPTTLASLTITDGIGSASALSVDKNGDGASIVKVTPKAGETVSYVEPRRSHWGPMPLIKTDSKETSQDAVSVSTSSPVASAVSTESRATTTPIIETVATSTTETVVIQERPTIISLATKRPSVSVAAPLVVANSLPDLSQTASAYGASQQHIFAKLGSAVYNGLYGLWTALKNFFYPT